MFGCTLWPIVLGGIGLAMFGQDAVVPMQRKQEATPLEAARDDSDDVEVTVSKLTVYDQPSATAYRTGSLKQGDRLKVRKGVADGWLAIDPPSSAICWIDGSALDFGSDVNSSGSHVLDREDSKAAIPTRSWVVANQARLRSGHPAARLPGPPCGSLSKGTMVHLVDRPPIKFGRGTASTTWYAILPPTGVIRYIRADGTKAVARDPSATAERLAAYAPTQDGAPSVEKLSPPNPPPENRAGRVALDLPPDIAADIAKVDDMHRTILTDQPIDQWRFDTVRARYQAILKRGSGNPSVEEAIRSRLARLTRHEQAAEAARTIQTILARSHRRDSKVAAAERRQTTPGPERPRSYSAEGLVKPSARMVEGRRLYSLIGANGMTVAYLDVPPGLDIEPLMTRRIGVRGTSHYNEDLGARLITVRDVEPLETRR
jgi:hypothetical protein